MNSHWPQIAQDGTIVGKPPRWSAERIARLAYLYGIGKNAEEIAVDHIVCSTKNNVLAKIFELGLAPTYAAEAYQGDRWTQERLALLGYMLGLGCAVEEIAARLNLTVNQIHRHANRMHTVFAGVARNK